MSKNILNCDLVVLGAGGAGVLAATKARSMGVKKVIILEKAKHFGGCTWYCSAAPAPFKSSPEQIDERFTSIMKELWWQVNPKLIRNNLEAQAECFDWFSKICDVTDFYTKEQLEGKMDFRAMMNSTQRAHRHMNDKSRDPSIGPGKAGSWFVTKLVDYCKKQGIEILTETPATEFLLDGTGKIKGVVAKDKDGGELQINCKACVVATGGFGANAEKLRKRWPEHFNGKRYHRFSCPTDTGDALDMAENAGINVDWKNMNVLIGGPAHHPYSFSILNLTWNPEVVYINLNGERWIDETMSFSNSFVLLGRQPKGENWIVMDESLKEMLGDRLQKSQLQYNWILKDYEKDIEYEISLDEGGAAGKHSRRADTLEGLAEKIEVDPGTFVKTIERYNQFCDNKRDLDFYKKSEYLIPLRNPPYYAFFTQRFVETTHGGIVTNENMEVYKDPGKTQIVQGLYAAGDTSGGWITDYIGMPPISAGTYMVSSGYLAGKAAGKYLLEG